MRKIKLLYIIFIVIILSGCRKNANQNDKGVTPPEEDANYTKHIVEWPKEMGINEQYIGTEYFENKVYLYTTGYKTENEAFENVIFMYELSKEGLEWIPVGEVWGEVKEYHSESNEDVVSDDGSHSFTPKQIHCIRHGLGGKVFFVIGATEVTIKDGTTKSGDEKITVYCLNGTDVSELNGVEMQGEEGLSRPPVSDVFECRENNLAVRYFDGTIRIFDMASGAMVKEYLPSEYVSGLKMTANELYQPKKDQFMILDFLTGEEVGTLACEGLNVDNVDTWDVYERDGTVYLLSQDGIFSMLDGGKEQIMEGRLLNLIEQNYGVSDFFMDENENCHVNFQVGKKSETIEKNQFVVYLKKQQNVGETENE